MSQTANLALSLLDPGQNQKEVTINEALTALDTIIGAVKTANNGKLLGVSGGVASPVGLGTGLEIAAGNLRLTNPYAGTMAPYLIDQAGLESHQSTWTTDNWKRGYRLASSSVIQFGDPAISGKAYGVGNYAGILCLFTATAETAGTTATTVLAVDGAATFKYHGSRTLLGGLADDTVSALQVNGQVAAGPKTAGRIELVPGSTAIIQGFDRDAGGYVGIQTHCSVFQVKPGGGQTALWIDNTGSYFYTAAGVMSLSLGGAAVVSYLPFVTTSYAMFPEVYIDSPSGSFGSLHLRGASNLPRWAIAKNSTAESGSNVGADFVIYRYNDAGGALGTPFSIERATGNITLENKLTAGASTTAGASINIPNGTAPTSPANGDIWFDGTDFKVRIAGVTKTVTVA